MSGLLEPFEALRAAELSVMPDARLEEDFAELQRASELLELERSRRLAEIERRGTYERDGHPSAAAWLVAAFRLSWGVARRMVKTAGALDAMPATAAAVETGEVSMCAAEVLTAARDADRDRFAEAEPMLLDAARIHTVPDLQRVVAYWRQACERQTPLGDADPVFKRRRLYASRTIFGMVRVDGDLEPEVGELFLTALHSVDDAWAHSGAGPFDRTASQRMHDALGDICKVYLDLAERPAVGGERPHVTVTIDVQTLTGDSGDACELDHAGVAHPSVARLLGCDASITRVVMAGPSQPLDVGRRTPAVPPAIRRAVIVRDRRCRFPNCDRPPPWCDAHHVRHWIDGGATALSNLVLLCRRHHRLVHTGFAVEMVNGQPIFRRRDGVVLEDRAPPPVWVA